MNSSRKTIDMIKNLLCIFFSCFALNANAFFGANLELDSSAVIENGGVVPVNLMLSKFGKDTGVKEVRLVAPGNGKVNELVFKAEFPIPLDGIILMTRARIANSPDALIKAIVTRGNGETLVKEFKFNAVANGVDFSGGANTRISVSQNGPFAFRSSDLYEDKLFYSRNGKLLHIGGRVQHPSDLKGGERSMNSLIIKFGETIFSNIEIGNAMSNDPFLILKLDTGYDGNEYEFIYTDSIESRRFRLRSFEK